jgi:lipid A 3-O-deacylase
LRTASCVLLALLCATPVAAADLGLSPSAVPYSAPASRSFLSEIRVGGSIQDASGPESGSGSITGEILFPRLFETSNTALTFLIPRPHVGGSANLSGRTSFAYAGLTWTLDIGPAFFIEGTFGGAVHNGDVGRIDLSPHDAALGCSPLFRESASAGWRITPQWSAIATVEHLSNAGLCAQNRGLTNVGLRLGYSF